LPDAVTAAYKASHDATGHKEGATAIPQTGNIFPSLFVKGYLLICESILVKSPVSLIGRIQHNYNNL
jgi:hypothetical protein